MPNSENHENAALAWSDYWLIATRKKALILLTAMAVTIVVIIVVSHMPNLYHAETMILVDPQQVPNTYVASTVSASISDRLSTIHQEVTSPTRLKRLIDSMHLFNEMRPKYSEEAIIAAMQKSITVQVVEQGGRGTSAFKVGFSGRDPVEVALITNRLAEMFISENLKVRERQSSGTAEFLDAELQRTKEQLDEKQAELNGLKSKYSQDLPESKQYHLEALSSLRGQLQVSQDRVNQAQQQKVYLQSMMTTQAPTVDLDTGAGESVYNPQVQKLESQLSSLKDRYGDKHPDVRKLESELRDLKSRQKVSVETGNVDAPPVIQQSQASKGRQGKNPVLVAQIEKLDDQIEKEKAQQQEMQTQIAFHMGKLQSIPIFEQQLSGKMWDYDSLRQHYSQLEDKKLSADMSSALETHEKGERFVVLDRAMVPSQPFAPKRGVISGIGLLAGLALGLVLAVLLEMSDPTIHVRAEVGRLLEGIPVLADIPSIPAAGENKVRLMRLGGAFLATTLGSVLIGLAISHFTTSV
jgi:polysaccharide chain length determinant protein (PEP-CTERM system associated)